MSPIMKNKTAKRVPLEKTKLNSRAVKSNKSVKAKRPNKTVSFLNCVS